MKLKYRRVIYSLFITFFAIAAPVIIIYTAGYRFNFKKNSVEKTGILYLESAPRQADIYINNRHLGQTPKRFAAMLPDIYDVRIEKEDHYTWQKPVEIKSNLTTFYRDIILFKKTVPVHLIEGEIKIFSINQDRDKLIYSIGNESGEELRMRNLRNQTDLLIKKYSPEEFDSLKLISWSPDNTNFLIKKGFKDFAEYEIVNADTFNIRKIFNITRANFTSLKWDNKNENQLYGYTDSELYQIDLINNSSASVIKGIINDFQVYNGDIYYIRNIGTNSFLAKMNVSMALLDENERTIQQIQLPAPANFILPYSIQEYIMLIDEESNDLFVLKENIFSSEEPEISDSIVLQGKANTVKWNNRNNNFIYSTDFEISAYDTSSGTSHLVTRYSSDLDKVSWYPVGNYIFFLTDNSIKNIESKNLDIKNELTISQLPTISDYVIDYNGKNIYFIGSIGNQKGIYQQELR